MAGLEFVRELMVAVSTMADIADLPDQLSPFTACLPCCNGAPIVMVQ
jgi:hypothetical protein